MANPTQPGGRRGIHTAAAATAVMLLIGVALIAVGMRSSGGPPQPAAASQSAAPFPSPEPQATPVTKQPNKQRKESSQSQQNSPSDRPDKAIDFGPILPASAPVALDIPGIAVHSTNIVDLGLAANGAIEVPEDPSTPGWFYPGPSPGQFGPAVIAGHVDSDRGPAVFYRLGELKPGDRVHVTRADGTVGTFLIDRVEAFAKAEFPTHEVYGDTTNRAELRLITCGGNYDEDAGYLGNVVAFAHLVSAH